jgi:hypothetical protein
MIYNFSLIIYYLHFSSNKILKDIRDKLNSHLHFICKLYYFIIIKNIFRIFYPLVFILKINCNNTRLTTKLLINFNCLQLDVKRIYNLSPSYIAFFRTMICVI